MKIKKCFKQINRDIGRGLLFGMRWIIQRIPYSMLKFFSFGFILLARLVLAGKRKIAMNNLNIAFGEEKTISERKSIFKHCFNYFSSGMIELIYYLDRMDTLMSHVDFEGKEYLDSALEKGNGAILVSAHFGNFIAMYLKIIHSGYKTNIIMRRVRDDNFEKFLTDFRNEQGMNNIYAKPQRRCIQQSIKALRNNEVLIILIDQNYGGDGGVFVDFFGKKAATATGPVIFSQRTDSPILPMFIVRQSGDKHKIIIEPPVELIPADVENSVQQNMSKLTNVIEKYVRQYPYEWGGWMHKRWKTEYKE